MVRHTQSIGQQLAEELFLTTLWGWHLKVCGIFLRKLWTTKNYFHKKLLSEILDGVLYVAPLSLLLKTCSKQTIYKHGKDNIIFFATLGFLLLTPDAVVHRYFSLLIWMNEVLSHDSLCSLMTLEYLLTFTFMHLIQKSWLILQFTVMQFWKQWTWWKSSINQHLTVQNQQ